MVLLCNSDVFDCIYSFILKQICERIPMYISNRLSLLKPSATVAFTEKARKLQKAGHDVIVLAAGEPDFTPSRAVREAVKREALEGPTCYGPTAGYLEVRQALVEYLERTKGLRVNTDQVILSNGAKQALFNALAALIDPGDEVIVPAPYWVSFTAQVELLGGVVRIVTAESSNGFKVTPEQIHEALTPKTRCIIFNNPCNPSGAYYTADDVRELTEICTGAGCAIVSDEVYDMIIFEGGPYLSPAVVSDEAGELTAVVGGFSKTYAMPGWRIGYLAGPEPWIKKVTSFQGQATHHPSALAQAAALAAMTGDQQVVEEMRQEFLRRRDFLLEAISGIPGLCVDVPPQGAFYLLVGVAGLIEALPDAEGSTDVSTWLLEEAKVALVPGVEFGAEGFLRVSYAASMEDLERAVQRIDEAVRKLGL